MYENVVLKLRNVNANKGEGKIGWIEIARDQIILNLRGILGEIIATEKFSDRREEDFVNMLSGNNGDCTAVMKCFTNDTIDDIVYVYIQSSGTVKYKSELCIHHPVLGQIYDNSFKVYEIEVGGTVVYSDGFEVKALDEMVIIN